MKAEIIYQVLTTGRYGDPTLQQWFTTSEDADKAIEDFKSLWPNNEFWIEEGTDYIYTKCRGCQTVHAYERHDAYGITTGHWCKECYDSSKYPYRKDKYDYQSAGERLEPEDY